MTGTGAKRWLIVGIAVVALISAGATGFNRYYLGVALEVGINVILAVSLNLINGYTGQFSLGHGGFMAVGAYLAAKLTLMFGQETSQALQPLLFGGALLAGGTGAALAGLLVGVPSLRLRGDYLAVVTLCFGEIIRVVFQNSALFGAATGLSGIRPWTTVFWSWGLAVVAVYVVLALVHSTYGRGFLAVSDDEIAASAMGLNPVRYKVTAFVVGAFFAGLAGGLFAHLKQAINPEGFNFMRSVDVVVMVILGGMGNTAGVVAAAVLLTVLPELLRGFSEYRMILYAVLIIVLMLVRPQGLFSVGGKGGRL
jgi:branched-chain amino acid transport system permease protein